MDKLRPVKDVWGELSDVDTTDEVALGIIQADREAVVQACADAVNEEGYEPITKPPESDRVRLGRVAYEANGATYPWKQQALSTREPYCIEAAAVRAELDKIKEEQKV